MIPLAAELPVPSGLKSSIIVAKKADSCFTFGDKKYLTLSGKTSTLCHQLLITHVYVEGFLFFLTINMEQSTSLLQAVTS